LAAIGVAAQVREIMFHQIAALGAARSPKPSTTPPAGSPMEASCRHPTLFLRNHATYSMSDIFRRLHVNGDGRATLAPPALCPSHPTQLCPILPEPVSTAQFDSFFIPGN